MVYLWFKSPDLNQTKGRIVPPYTGYGYWMFGFVLMDEFERKIERKHQNEKSFWFWQKWSIFCSNHPIWIKPNAEQFIYVLLMAIMPLVWFELGDLNQRYTVSLKMKNHSDFDDYGLSLTQIDRFESNQKQNSSHTYHWWWFCLWFDSNWCIWIQYTSLATK